MKVVGIEDIAYYLPEATVTNDDLKVSAGVGNFNVRRAEMLSGIKSRHIEDISVPVSEMACRAAGNLFSQNRARPEKIDFLIVVTQTGDYRLPATACVVQDRLGLGRNVGALDINLGCSGYVYGLAVAKSLVLGGLSRKTLLIAAEKPLLYAARDDMPVRFLHGDAAAATLVSADNLLASIGEFDFGTDGSGAGHLIVRAGGSALPTDLISSPDSRDNYVTMDGLEIFNFSVNTAPASIRAALAKNGVTVEDVACFVLHQANRLIVEEIAARLGIEGSRVPTNVEKVGNTSSVSIPLILTDILRNSDVRTEDKILLSGFGVGLSWASTVLTKL